MIERSRSDAMLAAANPDAPPWLCRGRAHPHVQARLHPDGTYRRVCLRCRRSSNERIPDRVIPSHLLGVRVYDPNPADSWNLGLPADSPGQLAFHSILSPSD